MDAFLKIRQSALEQRDGIFYYRGEPFNGVSIEINDGLISAETQVAQGLPTGVYCCEYLPLAADAIRVEEYCKDLVGSKEYETTQQFRYQGEVFTGIFYEFQDECCIYMGTIVNGFADLELDWYCDGSLEAYSYWRNNSGGDFEFHGDGSLDSIYQCKGSKYRLSIKFDQLEQITSLDLMGVYFDIKDDLVDRLPFQFVAKTRDLGNFSAAPEILFMGDGCDDALFQSMFDAGCFTSTRSIDLYDTGLTGNLIQTLAAIEDLQKLSILDNAGLLEDAVTELADLRPDVRLNYRRE